MKIFKIILNFLPSIAIAFAVIYFIRIDAKIEISQPNFLLLFLSFVILQFAFFSKSVLWYLCLLRFGIRTHFKVAFVSQFKSILMKYIPGKIWVIIGRANIISQQGFPLKYCSFLSGLMQLLTVTSGLIVGIMGIVFFEFFFLPSVVFYALLTILIIVLLFFSRERNIPELHLKRILKTLQPLSGHRIPPVLDIIILSILHWLLMGVAFFLFIKSIFSNVGFHPILLQPLANNIGIISPFSPGGLGVREGVMIGYLTIGGMSLATATNISIAARFWFFMGELFVFIGGWAIQRIGTNNTK